MKGVFQFKQFTVRHQRSAMKVGTDGVLLGAYADVNHATKILDIGTGCGLIAIMLAQRCNANITGIEIDKESAAEAQFNAEQCPWKQRIFIRHASLQEFSSQTSERFDLIVCNPPYFSNQLRSPDEDRNLVRHDIKLNYQELITGARKLLEDDGEFWVILPCSETEGLIVQAMAQDFHIDHYLTIIPKEGKESHRNIIVLTKNKNVPPERNILTIRNADDTFTQEYIRLTKEFYINF